MLTKGLPFQFYIQKTFDAQIVFNKRMVIRIDIAPELLLELFSLYLLWIRLLTRRTNYNNLYQF